MCIPDASGRPRLWCSRAPPPRARRWRSYMIDSVPWSARAEATKADFGWLRVGRSRRLGVPRGATSAPRRQAHHWSGRRKQQASAPSAVDDFRGWRTSRPPSRRTRPASTNTPGGVPDEGVVARRAVRPLPGPVAGGDRAAKVTAPPPRRILRVEITAFAPRGCSLGAFTSTLPPVWDMSVRAVP